MCGSDAGPEAGSRIFCRALHGIPTAPALQVGPFSLALEFVRCFNSLALILAELGSQQHWVGVWGSAAIDSSELPDALIDLLVGHRSSADLVTTRLGPTVL